MFSYEKIRIDNYIVCYRFTDTNNWRHTFCFNDTTKLPEKFILESNIFNTMIGKYTFYTGSGFILQSPPIEDGIINRKYFGSLKLDAQRLSPHQMRLSYEEMKKFLSGNSFNLSFTKEDEKLETKTECNHQWVNYGFTSLSYCCKFCGIEKP